jgi:uncharacterized protein (DUF433 family)
MTSPSVCNILSARPSSLYLEPIGIFIFPHSGQLIIAGMGVAPGEIIENIKYLNSLN